MQTNFWNSAWETLFQKTLQIAIRYLISSYFFWTTTSWKLLVAVVKVDKNESQMPTASRNSNSRNVTSISIFSTNKTKQIDKMIVSNSV